VIELSEVAGPKGKLFRMIREASESWDGRDPVRPFPDLAVRCSAMTRADRLEADYLLETPLDPRRSRTCSRRAEQRHVRARRGRDGRPARAQPRTVDRVEELRTATRPSLRARGSSARAWTGPYRRARVTVSFPRRQHW
jgi:hypothetical protein